MLPVVALIVMFDFQKYDSIQQEKMFFIHSVRRIHTALSYNPDFCIALITDTSFTSLTTIFNKSKVKAQHTRAPKHLPMTLNFDLQKQLCSSFPNG